MAHAELDDFKPVAEIPVKRRALEVAIGTGALVFHALIGPESMKRRKSRISKLFPRSRHINLDIDTPV